MAGPKVADNSLTGSDVAEATLGKVPNADALDGFDSRAFARTARVTVVLDLPAIGADSCINRLIPISALEAADGVLVNPPGNLPLGLVLTPTADVNQDTLQELRVCNVTNGTLDRSSSGVSQCAACGSEPARATLEGRGSGSVAPRLIDWPGAPLRMRLQRGTAFKR